ncbi:hypothetical protein SAMN05421644_11026 [Allochromatium warmingii]|uniref:DUF3077 domain-containing protein n=1 Tax=Allochromatium warmingii TaxID=61595 RepID=A0A1H3DVF3_ALLWA|nr:hypothetical protein [Allochromatium warmingii]SDX70310.1 hypothetical protein SAMN05421644_11026 [Allochromatium warmingii]
MKTARKTRVRFGQFNTPEELLAVRADAHAGLHINALEATLIRVAAVLDLLTAVTSDLANGSVVNQQILADGIWTASGLVAEARLIVEHVSKGGAVQ